MKNILATTFAFGVLSWAGSALATPVTFDVDSDDSYVAIGNTSTFWGDTSISATLAKLDSDDLFTLDDNESKVIDFFTLSVTGTGIGSFDLDAKLEFDAPAIGAGSHGDGGWIACSFEGATYSAGRFSWNNAVQTFTLADGETTVQIALEDGFACGVGSSTTIHATITNLGAAPVPEPATILILGTGLLGIIGFNRKRFKKS